MVFPVRQCLKAQRHTRRRPLLGGCSCLPRLCRRQVCCHRRGLPILTARLLRSSEIWFRQIGRTVDTKLLHLPDECGTLTVRPNRAAAPFGPPTTQRVFPSVSMMCSRSHSSSVAAFAVPPRATLTVWPLDGCSSSRGALRTFVRDRMTARSTKFSSSRTLPGQ